AGSIARTQSLDMRLLPSSLFQGNDDTDGPGVLSQPEALARVAHAIRLPLRLPMTLEAATGGVQRIHQAERTTRRSHLANDLLERIGRTSKFLQGSPFERIRRIGWIAGREGCLLQTDSRALDKMGRYP